MSQHPAEKLWREIGLPEYFLGNGGTNTKLYDFYDAVVKECAQIADQFGEFPGPESVKMIRSMCATAIAEKIRALAISRPNREAPRE